MKGIFAKGLLNMEISKKDLYQIFLQLIVGIDLKTAKLVVVLSLKDCHQSLELLLTTSWSKLQLKNVSTALCDQRKEMKRLKVDYDEILRYKL